MNELFALLHGPAAGIGIAGFAALWAVKAVLGWRLLRWLRGRRPS